MAYAYCHKCERPLGRITVEEISSLYCGQHGDEITCSCGEHRRDDTQEERFAVLASALAEMREAETKRLEALVAVKKLILSSFEPKQREGLIKLVELLSSPP